MKKIINKYGIVLSILVSQSLYVINAQPSGGPYGPIDKSYEIPETQGKIYYVSPEGLTESAGLIPGEPTTVEAAVERVVTGDAIIMRGGVYRTGDLTFNQGITIQPFKDEHPVLKGTKVATGWKKENDSLWSVKWDRLFPAGPESWWEVEHNIMHTPLHRFNNDVVFIDGKFLQSAGNTEEVNEGTFYVDYDAKQIYIGTNPEGHLIEITAFRKAIFRTKGSCHGKKSDGIGPVIRGLEITQYPDTTVHVDGFYPQGISPEKEHGNDVKGTVIENCSISECFRIGAFLIGDNLTVRNCKITNTSTEGLYIVASDDVLLEKNIFTKNNIENISGYFASAVKIFNQCYRVVCNDNLVTSLDFSNGVWYDVGNVNGVFINNWVENVGENDFRVVYDWLWPSDNAFFFEISKGLICAGNVFYNCDHGMMVLNSCDVKAYNNTFINSMACFGRTERGDSTDHFGWHITTGPGVEERDGHSFVNNILWGNPEFIRPLLFVYQKDKLCDRLKEPQLDVLDHNVYVRNFGKDFQPIVLLGPAQNDDCQDRLNTFDKYIKMYPQYTVNSIHMSSDKPLFKNVSGKDFRIDSSVPPIDIAAPVPPEIKQWFHQADDRRYVGAYSR